jgi:uncharacterized protein (TIGR03437 family)
VAGGHVSDIALDERRGVLYIANFTADEISVMSLRDNQIQRRFPTAAQPGTLAMSRDGRYLVIGHHAAFANEPPRYLGLTVIDLDGNTTRNIDLKVAPLAIAFGNGPRALLITRDGVWLFNPATGAREAVQAGCFASRDLPVPFATFPPEIIRASSTVSGDGNVIYAIVDGPICSPTSSGSAVLRYQISTNELQVMEFHETPPPPHGPRVINTDHAGSAALAAWTLVNNRNVVQARVPYPLGTFNYGSHAWQYTTGTVFAQFPTGPDAVSPLPTPSPLPLGQPQPTQPVGELPVLHVLDADNFTVRERIRIPENLAGRSLLSSDMQTMYSVSDSGVLVLPVGSLARTPRVAASREDVLFRASTCDNRILTQEFDVIDPGGGNTDFQLSLAGPAKGLQISTSSGITPARVQISLDPTAYQNDRGTTEVMLHIGSGAGVNLPPPVRLLINMRTLEQRGNIHNVPGTLVDMLPDPFRERIYVLRQDKNEVHVFNSRTWVREAVLRTGNTPVQMAISEDSRNLLVTNENSQLVNVFDLDALRPTSPVEIRSGHYARSIAVTRGHIFGVLRPDTPIISPPGYVAHLVEINLAERRVITLPTLGIYGSGLWADTMLATSPTRASMLMALPDGTLVFYDASRERFVASRQDSPALSGAFGALSDDLFFVGENILNRSLVPVARFQANGTTAGITTLGQTPVRISSTSAPGPGSIDFLGMSQFDSIGPTSTIESPLIIDPAREAVAQVGEYISPFTRSLAVAPGGAVLVSLSTSGFMTVPSDFNALAAPPVVDSISSSADGSGSVARGSTVTIHGSNFSSVTELNEDEIASDSLAGVCVLLNNLTVPLLRVSPTQIDVQLPFDAPARSTLKVKTAGGTGNSVQVEALRTAPAIFLRSGAGGQPAIYRADGQPVTPERPIAFGETITIFATGLGEVAPRIETGKAAPPGPLSAVVTQPVVKLGGHEAHVAFAGLVPGTVGIYQLNVRVPALPAAETSVPLSISQGGSGTVVNVSVVPF